MTNDESCRERTERAGCKSTIELYVCTFVRCTVTTGRDRDSILVHGGLRESGWFRNHQHLKQLSNQKPKGAYLTAASPFRSSGWELLGALLCLCLNAGLEWFRGGLGSVPWLCSLLTAVLAPWPPIFCRSGSFTLTTYMYFVRSIFKFIVCSICCIDYFLELCLTAVGHTASYPFWSVCVIHKNASVY